MNHRKIIRILFFVLFTTVIILFLRILRDGYNFWSKTSIQYDVTGQIGDFIGGVFGTIIAAAGFYFLYLTFSDQRTAFTRERLESKFFELIKMHRENVSALKFDATKLKEDEDSLYIEKKVYEGMSVFKVIFNQFVICRNELRQFFRKGDIYLPSYEKSLRKNSFIKENNISLNLLAQIDICYSIVYYGLSSEGLLILESIFRNRYKTEFISTILKYLSLKPAYDEDILERWLLVSHRGTKIMKVKIVDNIYKWRKTKTIDDNNLHAEIITEYHNRFIKYYGGHQFRLGHYFRHLFQSIKFMNNQNFLDYQTKYEYVKTFRSQLSIYEQAVLFLDSLSKMGAPWELEAEINTKLTNYNRQDFELITKYNLIKNLPGHSLYGIRFKNFYPLIEYEGDGIIKNRPTYN